MRDSAPTSSRTNRRRRRTALFALGAIAILAVGIWIQTTRGGVDRPADWFTNTHGTDRERIDIESEAVGKRLPVEVIVPDTDEPSSGRPMLVLLHGRGTPADKLSNSALTKAVSDAGANAPIVVLPYGDEASYWHNRGSGRWGDYVMDEVIPTAAEKFDGDAERVAIGGISMGGFGAFNLARLNPGEFCAVGGHSPAFWQTSGETAEGAFDNAEDFAANDVVAAAASGAPGYADTEIWLDSGDEDPFRPGYQSVVNSLRASGANLTERTWPGEHENAYWESHYARYLKFYTNALRKCDRT